MKWYYEFTEEEKKKFKELTPKKYWENIFFQRMFKLEPKIFEKIAKKRLKEVI